MFNWSGIPSKFLSKTVQKKTYVLINLAFLYNLGKGLIDTNIGIQRNDTAIIDFTSCIFFYKLKIFQLSVMVLLSTIKHFNQLIHLLDSQLREDLIQQAEIKKLTAAVRFYKACRSAYILVSEPVFIEE
ncbi:hypothetical protein CDIK_3629 [Cucumispora dikerogammari]|nr:hypothetical protein CDIK_3629 [Cucumispora dikerogammari]